VPESFGRLQRESGLGHGLPWIRTLLEKRSALYRVRGYASGQLRVPDRTWDSFSWPSAYNRPNQVLAIQDIITAMQAIKQALPAVPLTVIGLERAGVPATFAAAVHGGAARAVLDMNGEDPAYDGTLLRLLPVGSIRRVGDFRTALLLIGGDIELLNPGPTFDNFKIVPFVGGIGARHDTGSLKITEPWKRDTGAWHRFSYSRTSCPCAGGAPIVHENGRLAESSEHSGTRIHADSMDLLVRSGCPPMPVGWIKSRH
jgi:hypothetical protein